MEEKRIERGNEGDQVIKQSERKKNQLELNSFKQLYHIGALVCSNTCIHKHQVYFFSYLHMKNRKGMKEVKIEKGKALMKKRRCRHQKRE